MRRIIVLVASSALAVGLFGAFVAPAGAQTGDVAAVCAARIDGNSAQGKAENLATMNRALAAAPASFLPQITALRDAFQKKGEKIFNSPTGFQLITAVDTWIYDNCPGAKVPVTAIDYQFQNVPATLKAGPTTFKLTNSAPKEDHEMGIVKMTAAAQGQDLQKLLALPEKKQAKYFEFDSATGMFAPNGQVGYAPTVLEPGTYAYACFLPVGGKKNGAPHFTQGMYGSFTVS